MKEFGLAGMAMVVLLGLVWIIQGNEFFLMKVFGPKTEEVRRQTFEESKAYNEGMVQEIRRMQLEYIQAVPEQRRAITSVILHETAGFDRTKLPTDLQLFLGDLRRGEGL